jgi:hypothetical protein
VNHFPDINPNKQQVDNAAQDDLTAKNLQVNLNQSTIGKEEKTDNQTKGDGKKLDKSIEIKVSVTHGEISNNKGKDMVKAAELNKEATKGDSSSKELAKIDSSKKEVAKIDSSKKEENNKESLEGLTGTKINMDDRRNEKTVNKSKVSARKLLKKPSVASGVGELFHYSLVFQKSLKQSRSA